MDIPKILAQWTALHDACLAEAQSLVGAQCNAEAIHTLAEAIHTLAETASICVDALMKLKGEPQLLNRSDLP